MKVPHELACQKTGTKIEPKKGHRKEVDTDKKKKKKKESGVFPKSKNKKAIKKVDHQRTRSKKEKKKHPA